MTAISPSNIGKPNLNEPVWFGGRMPVARLGLILNLTVPLVILIWDSWHGMLGADPVHIAIHITGIIAVVYLLLSLCITPVRMLTGWSWVVQFRRSLGVYAFYYASVHLAIYFWWDRNRSLSSTVYEITHRWYLMIGFYSLALMAPLWATSFNAAIRAMGGTWWKRLHKLAYVAAALAVWHFYLQSKADKREPEIFIAVLAGLMLWRIGADLVGLARAPAKVARGFPVVSVTGEKARFWKGDLKVVGMFKETASVRTFRLAPVDGGAIPFIYQAGQFLSLAIETDGRRVSRSYTIASPPTRQAYIELTIKREERGHVSGFLHDKLMSGHTVSVSAPAGRFSFDPYSQQAAPEGVVLIAGGVGITPVMSILRDLTDRCWMGRIDLIFSVRSPADVIFADELRYLAQRHANLKVHLTCTRDVPADWQGQRGRITGELLKLQVPDLANRPAFICGPDEMARAAKAELIAVGVPASQITLESFTPQGTIAVDNGVKSGALREGAVTFNQSDRTAPLLPGKSILELAESAGVKIDYECRSGICGTCRCRLVSGHVTMQTKDALSSADEADGYILACQAFATGDVTVEA